MRRHNLAVGLVGIAALLAACGKGGGELPLLPGAQNASAGGEKAMAASADSSMMVANIRYELADGVTSDAKTGKAYNFANVTESAVKKLASALGVTGDVKKDGAAFTMGGGDGDKPSLYVNQNGGVFSMSVSYAVSGSGSSGCAVAPAPDKATADGMNVGSDTPSCEPLPAPTTTVPKDAPTADEAKAVAKKALADGGVDVDGAKVTVESFDGATQNVRFQNVVDGHSVDGYETYVTVGPKNAIVSASGYLVNPSAVGDYDLASLDHAVARLNESYGKATTLEARDDIAVGEPVPGQPEQQQEPTVVKLTSVSVGLLMQSDYDGNLWLVPSYDFGTGDGGKVAAYAADDKYIAPPPTQPAPSPADTGATKPGQVDPAPPANNCKTFDGDISGQICASDAKAGEPVRFSITAADPDRGFATGCFDGVEVAYGDNGAGDIRCEACATEVPAGGGKLGVERVHVYEKPGTYTAKFTIKSGADCGPSDPKDSSTTVEMSIKVA